MNGIRMKTLQGSVDINDDNLVGVVPWLVQHPETGQPMLGCAIIQVTGLLPLPHNKVRADIEAALAKHRDEDGEPTESKPPLIIGAEQSVLKDPRFPPPPGFDSRRRR